MITVGSFEEAVHPIIMKTLVSVIDKVAEEKAVEFKAKLIRDIKAEIGDVVMRIGHTSDPLSTQKIEVILNMNGNKV